VSVDDHGLEGIRKSAEQDPIGQRNEYRLKVRVTNSNLEPIPVVVLDAEPGVPSHQAFQGATVPGVDTTLITSTVTTTSRTIVTMLATCRIESVFYLKVGASIIGSCRTSAASPNGKIEFRPGYSVPITSIITVSVKARTGSPISDCEAYLMGLNVI
jgi:hypothetical protein